MTASASYPGGLSMSYRVKRNESPEQALHRIGRQQLKRALLALSSDMQQGERAIHETRKCLKRIRALLRLMRPGLTGADFKSENARYRDISRRLSATRDAQVLTQTLSKLEHYAEGQDASALMILRGYITATSGQSARELSPELIDTACNQLTSAKEAMANLRLTQPGPEIIEKGLARAYNKGCCNFRLAYHGGNSESFHEWRKTVQLHWRHMSLTSLSCGELFSARIEAARELSQILGDAQDLSVLIGHIAQLPTCVMPSWQVEKLLELSCARQQQLRALAHPRGAQLFAASPKALARSVRHIWRAADELDVVAVEMPDLTPRHADETHGSTAMHGVIEVTVSPRTRHGRTSA